MACPATKLGIKLYFFPSPSLYPIHIVFIYNCVPFNLKHLKDGTISSLIQLFKIIQNLVKNLDDLQRSLPTLMILWVCVILRTDFIINITDQPKQKKLKTQCQQWTGIHLINEKNFKSIYHSCTVAIQTHTFSQKII